MKVGTKVEILDGWHRIGYPTRLGTVLNTWDGGGEGWFGPCSLVEYADHNREWIPDFFLRVLDGVTVMLAERDGVL